MAVSFNQIPAVQRVPLFYAEVDNSQASYFAQSTRALLIGTMLTSGVATAGTAYLVTRLDVAKSYFGVGSQLTRMVDFFKRNNPNTELWAIGVVEAAAGAAAIGTVTFTGTATAAGTLAIYIAGQLLQVGVTVGMTAAQAATALAAVIAATPDLPVTAAAATTVVTMTARHKGIFGNDIDTRLNYRGNLGGEATPAGLTATIVQVGTATAGTGSPDLTVAMTGMGNQPYDYIGLGFNDATSLTALQAEMSSVTGRWSYSQQIYGGVFAAKRGTVGALTTFGGSVNDEHMSVMGYNDGPNPPWEWAAAYTAQEAGSLSIDPARPTQTLPLVGILPPPDASQYLNTERATLLNNGVATWVYSGGFVRIERAITTYQKNAYSQPDPSYLDSETLYTLANILRFLKTRITQKFGRHKLANDGTLFGPGQAIVSPNIIRAELIAAYSELETQGQVENAAAFAAALIVERNVNDPNRIDVLYPPDLVNQLRVFALLAQFRLQYQAVAA